MRESGFSKLNANYCESFKSLFVHKMSVGFFFPPQGYFESKYLEAAIHSWLF